MSEQDKTIQIGLESGTYETQGTRKFAQRKLYEKQDPRVIKAVIPGAIDSIDTAVGKQVRQGDVLLILEAMKMHNRIKAPVDGTVRAIPVAVGEKIVKGQILVEIE